MRVLMPQNLAEACELLGTDPALMPVAGATDVMAHWPVRPEARELGYLDLSAITELRGIRWSADSVTLGAGCTYWEALSDTRLGAEFPLLHAAARQIGAIQIQSRGTWAGNIVNASPAADGVPALMAYDAQVVLTSRTGSRRVRLDEFYLGYKKMARRPDELVTAIELPRRPYTLAVFEKVGGRRMQAITKVGVAITRSEAGWRVVAVSVAPTIRRCPSVERLLESGPSITDADGLLAPLAADVTPIDDIRSTAEYRRRVLANLIYHALRGKSQWVN